MCGINLIVDKFSKLDENPICRMNAVTRHRGPENENYKWFSSNGKNIFLGANRLRITAPEAIYDQPLVSAEANFALIFNGEVYNYQDLASRNGIDTNSDAFALFFALQKNSIDVLSELNGMFTLAFYDRKKDELILARDGQGIKPLYYYEDERYFIASSEIKGIFASGLVEKKLNEIQLANYLKYRYAKSPDTLYKGVKCVEAGSYIRISGLAVEQKYFYERPVLTQKSIKSLEAETEDILFQAVQRQLPKDASTGLMLSGGVDSSLLLAMIHKQGLRNFPVFSIMNSSSDENYGTADYKFIEKAASLYNADLSVEQITTSTLGSFHEFLDAVDQPVADSAGWLTWLITRKAQKDVKVMLSGAGADELFAGYNRHKAFQTYLSIAPLGTPLMKKLAIFPESDEVPFRKNFRGINKFLSGLEAHPSATWENFISLGLGAKHSKYGKADNISLAGGDLLDVAIRHDRDNYLVSDILQISDSFSMANSVELRVPFLDKALYNFASSIPASQLLAHGKKWILKSVLKRHGGQVFTNRPKEGFGMPIGKWLREKEGEFLLQYLTKDNYIFDFLEFEEVEKLKILHMTQKKDLSAELFSLILLSAWMNKEFR